MLSKGCTAFKMGTANDRTTLRMRPRNPAGMAARALMVNTVAVNSLSLNPAFGRGVSTTLRSMKDNTSKVNKVDNHLKVTAPARVDIPRLTETEGLLAA